MTILQILFTIVGTIAGGSAISFFILLGGIIAEDTGVIVFASTTLGIGVVFWGSLLGHHLYTVFSAPDRRTPWWRTPLWEPAEPWIPPAPPPPLWNTPEHPPASRNDR